MNKNKSQAKRFPERAVPAFLRCVVLAPSFTGRGSVILTRTAAAVASQSDLLVINKVRFSPFPSLSPKLTPPSLCDFPADRLGPSRRRFARGDEARRGPDARPRPDAVHLRQDGRRSRRRRRVDRGGVDERHGRQKVMHGPVLYFRACVCNNVATFAIIVSMCLEIPKTCRVGHHKMAVGFVVCDRRNTEEMPRRSGDAAALDTDYSEVDATSPLLPHPATQSAAPSGARRHRQPRRPNNDDDDDEADVEQQQQQPLSGDESLDDGETAYARLRWAVASLIIASFIAVVLWLALGGGSSARDRCRNRDPGFPGQDQVGYAGPTPTVSLSFFPEQRLMRRRN
jgi:hypothetical protein